MPLPENVVAAPAGPNTASSPWVGSNGTPAHPDSPAGGGGPGFFDTGIAGLSGNDSSIIPHPGSPVGREYQLRQGDIDKLNGGGVALDTNVKITETKVARNDPPATVAGTFAGAKRSSTTDEIAVTVVVEADGTDSKRPDHAYIEMKQTNDFAVVPEFDVDVDKVNDKGEITQKGTGKVTLKGKVTFKPTVTLKIYYGTNVSAKSPSAYGRGTTDEDVKKLDTTLGFHEACHLADSKAYFAAVGKLPKSFPSLTFKSENDLKAAVAAYEKSFEPYFDNDRIESKAKTDEVGDTLAAYVAKHPGYDH